MNLWSTIKQRGITAFYAFVYKTGAGIRPDACYLLLACMIEYINNKKHKKTVFAIDKSLCR